MKILVTGGAGFIGSHLCGALQDGGHAVVCADNLSLGSRANIKHLLERKRFSFVKMDVSDEGRLSSLFSKERFSCVFHLAANSDIARGGKDPSLDYRNTFLTTFSVLSCMRKHAVKKLVFASTSAVYGENYSALSENTGPLCPVSFYGAAKLSSEGYVSAFSANDDIRTWVIRFPNVVGGRATHGVIFDFVSRLRQNPRELVILGDGRQKKPYLHVRDLIAAILHVWKFADRRFNLYNAGAPSSTTVSRIASVVAEEMGLKPVFRYTGGDRGWKGDVPRFSYSLKKIGALGWKPSMTSDEAVRQAVRDILGKA